MFASQNNNIMEFKGTQGKWHLKGCPYYDDDSKEHHGAFTVVTEEAETTITCVKAYSFYGQTLETATANALLISKAPEMLEMLKDIKDYLGSDKRMEVEQLIKEATKLK